MSADYQAKFDSLNRIINQYPSCLDTSCLKAKLAIGRIHYTADEFELAEKVLSTDVGFSLIPHASGFIHTWFTTPVNGVYINHCPSSGTSVLTSFKKGLTSMEELSESEISIYPSIVVDGEMITIQSDVFEHREIQVKVSNMIGQVLCDGPVKLGNDNTARPPASTLKHGVNFISVLNRSGQELINTKVIKN